MSHQLLSSAVRALPCMARGVGICKRLKYPGLCFHPLECGAQPPSFFLFLSSGEGLSAHHGFGFFLRHWGPVPITDFVFFSGEGLSAHHRFGFFLRVTGSMPITGFASYLGFRGPVPITGFVSLFRFRAQCPSRLLFFPRVRGSAPIVR